jgi:trimeric autotransporter adhesin
MTTPHLRKSIGQSPVRLGFLLISIVLACFALWPAPNAFGVSPPPDGGYPGNNTAEGTNALFKLTSGTANTAVGSGALFNNTTGGGNVGIGSGALALNQSGSFNMAIGTDALRNNTANANLAIGFRVLFANTTGNNLTGIGAGALFHNTTGSFNTAVGAAALNSNTTGANNTAVGRQALLSNTTASNNTAIGYQALQSNTTGFYNTASGDGALFSNTAGYQNTASGAVALYSNTTGVGNTALGDTALDLNTTGTYNTAVGFGAGGAVTTATDVICIGALGANIDNSCFIANIRGQTTFNNDALPVLIDSNNQLGTISSSRRFKREIKPMDKASEAILALKPVTFHYKSDKTNRPEFGLIAEEVARVNPDLVVCDAEGEIYTVRYEAVNAMLLNEFLKEHRKVQEQETTITELKSVVAQQQKDFQATVAHQQKQIEALTTVLQKVSAQLELRKSAPQTVANNQ